MTEPHVGKRHSKSDLGSRAAKPCCWFLVPEVPPMGTLHSPGRPLITADVPMGTPVFQHLLSTPGASQKNNTPNEVGRKICGNLASRTLLIYKFLQLFFFLPTHMS